MDLLVLCHLGRKRIGSRLDWKNNCWLQVCGSMGPKRPSNRTVGSRWLCIYTVFPKIWHPFSFNNN